MSQPLNRLAPFHVTYDTEEYSNRVLVVDENGVQVSAIIFSDGTCMTTAPVGYSSNPTDFDSGTF